MLSYSAAHLYTPPSPAGKLQAALDTRALQSMASRVLQMGGGGAGRGGGGGVSGGRGRLARGGR